jgi:twitching motility protein PilI
MEDDERKWLTPSEALTRFQPSGDLAATSETADDSRVRFGFRIGSLRLLIKPDSASEIVEQGSIHPIPATPPWLLGLINLRGNLVPVFHLHRLLEIGDDTQRKHTILMLDKDEDAVAIVIEGFPETFGKARKLERLPPLPAVMENHIQGAYVKDDKVWLEFDHKKFFKSIAEQFSAA